MENSNNLKISSKILIMVISTIFFSCVSLGVFYAIGGFGNEPVFNINKKTEMENSTSLSSFNEEEYLIYNILIDNSSKFYNPSSLRVVEISETYGDLPFVDLKLQAENKVGGTLTEYYTAYLEDNIDGITVEKGDLKRQIFQNTKIIIKSETSDVGKINKAINEYWESQGIY